MWNYLDELRNKPYGIRRKIAFIITVIVTVLVLIIALILNNLINDDEEETETEDNQSSALSEITDSIKSIIDQRPRIDLQDVFSGITQKAEGELEQEDSNE
jgi:hypothetical protein